MSRDQESGIDGLLTTRPVKAARALDSQAFATAFQLSQSCVRDLDGTIRLWSEGNQNLYGWSSEEALGLKTHDLLHTVFPKPLSEIEAELLTAGTWKGELLHTTKAGVQVWVASHWALHRKNGADDVLVVELNNDITERKRADEAAVYLASLVESSDDAIIGKALDGTVTSWNAGAERLFGYSKEEIIGKNILQLFPPELKDEELSILDRLGTGERMEHYETTRVAKSGKRVHVSLTVSPVFNAAGQIIGASKIARNVSEQKELQRELRESEERQRLAVEAGEIGLWFFDVRTRVSNWSERCKEILGFDALSQQQNSSQIIDLLHPEDLERVQAAFAQSIANKTVFEQDFRVLTPKGKLRWVHCKGRPDVTATGEVTSMHGALVDLTERKQAEEALTRVNDQLQQFAYAAAHDLQEPLRNVAMSVQLAQLRLNGVADEKTSYFLQTAVDNAHQMEAMVRDLLAYSRMFREEEGSEAVSDAGAVLVQALRNLAVRIQETDAEITQDDLPTVRMPNAHLLQLFQNLIDNSLKHLGPLPPRIHVRASSKKGLCVFSISDNGLGIEPQFQDRVFDVFKRLRKSNTQGTGVGLALCKRTVEHYGGTIWIESDGMTGTTFFFSVPNGDANSL